MGNACYFYIRGCWYYSSNLGELLKADTTGNGYNAIGLPVLDEAQSAKYIALY